MRGGGSGAPGGEAPSRRGGRLGMESSYACDRERRGSCARRGIRIVREIGIAVFQKEKQEFRSGRVGN